MKFFLKFLRLSLIGLFSAFTLGVVATAAAYLYLAPQLPSIESLKDVRLQTPLRVHSRDGGLIAEFGEKKRAPLKFEEAPDLMLKAILAAEDNRFYEHPGVDYQGILRAVVHLIKTGQKGQGGSTITMQVARNFFLSREKTYLRKISEIFLALKIERELSKQDILELYLNKIYLGHRSYGVAAAAQVYYGKNINDLSVPQVAMIAGLPKAPSRYNPITNIRRATIRRDYVLGRMFELGFIGKQDYEQAVASVDNARLHGQSVELAAPYMAEMVRAEMYERYGQEAYTSGYRVYTTLDTRLQRYADNAVHRNLLEYDQRHGYRGVEGHMTFSPELLAALPPIESPTLNKPKGLDSTPVVIKTLSEALIEPLRAELNQRQISGDLLPAVVLHLEDQAASVIRENGEVIRIDWNGLKWARRFEDENTRGPALRFAADILRQGDVIRIRKDVQGNWQLAQLPNVSGALVTLDPEDGAIQALIGGFDYYLSKFNLATQARRQPGSNIKPFIYSAALENGFTAASLINDAPVVFEDQGLENTWRPENYSGKFFGPTRLRVALTNSRNLVSIRLLRAIGIKTAISYLQQLGFDTDRLPKNLSLALGSASFTPLEVASAYAILANGGYRVEPYFIERIEDSEGNIIFQHEPLRVCRECEKIRAETEPRADTDKPAGTQPDGLGEESGAKPAAVAPRVMTAQTNYIMRTILRDVILLGTGRRALSIGRRDLAGKTGTTNDQKDAWFSGFSSTLVTTAWVGFDKHEPLGKRETGASAALPMWVYFMENAMKGVPEKQVEMPAGLVTIRVDPETGLLAAQGQENAIFETFRSDNVPKQTVEVNKGAGPVHETASPPSAIPEQLF
ncbi:penicillin-binding protein 1A [Sulfuriflexus mobilis]|uniref:penicillin-binding protein 1A n=1 Tax=Sulfuriflexus mobilis TaxID=1811807 RepID=UPI000F8483C8|nr:penicillin-binding protein 1A [Sulfuriflexus mobilis]